MRTPPLLLLCFAVFLLVSGCGPNDAEPDASSGEDATSTEPIPFDKEGELTIRSGSDNAIVTLQIEIAETDSARTRGMMQRESFPDNTSGMLFPFASEAPRYFHMSNTPLSLDLFFIDADSTIVSISKYARPFSSDLIESGAPAQYVLETPAGFADTYGITEGDRARWKRTDTIDAEPTISSRAQDSQQPAADDI